MSLARGVLCRRLSGVRRPLAVEPLEARCLCAADLAAASIDVMEAAADPVVSPPAIVDELALTVMPPVEIGPLAPDASAAAVGLDGWGAVPGDGGFDPGQGAWYDFMPCGFDLLQDLESELIEVPAPDGVGSGGIVTFVAMAGESARSTDATTSAPPGWAAAWAAFSITGRDASAAGTGEDGWRSRRVRARV